MLRYITFHCTQLAKDTSTMLIRRFHPNVYIYIYISYIYIYIYIYIYVNIILLSDRDLFKFLLIHSLFLFYFAELKFPVQCTDDS